MRLWRAARLAVEDCSCGGLGVDRIALAPPAPVLSVLSVHFNDLDAFTREVLREAGAVGTGALDADAQ